MRRRELIEALDRLPIDKISQAVKWLQRARQQGARIFTAGNGGSGSIASHFAGDLIKNSGGPINVVCLNDNMTALTAFANDDAYTLALSRVFHNLLTGSPRHGADVLFVISSSGHSANILDLTSSTADTDTHVIGLVGKKGSQLSKNLTSSVDLCIELDAPDYTLNEPLFSFVCHLIVEGLRPAIYV